MKIALYKNISPKKYCGIEFDKYLTTLKGMVGFPRQGLEIYRFDGATLSEGDIENLKATFTDILIYHIDLVEHR